MALIFCPECGTQVSEHAEKCVKCAYPISNRKNNYSENNSNSYENNSHFQSASVESSKSNKTDIFAILTFATGIGGFIFFPIFFVPICFITSWVSWYKLKEDKNLEGKNLRLIGTFLNAINIVWLQYTLHIFS